MVSLRDELIKSASEFLGISQEEVLDRIKNNTQNAVDDWNKKNSINGFYQTTDVYIYGLIDYCSERRLTNNLFPITDLSEKDVLDFGGGIGVHSLILSRNNNVYYYDLDSQTKEFAKYLNNTMNGRITFLGSEEEAYSKKYDVILALDVLEHLVNPMEVITKLTNSLKPNGLLITTGLDFSVVLDTPMHLIQNIEQRKPFMVFINKNFDLMYFLKSDEINYCLRKYREDEKH